MPRLAWWIWAEMRPFYLPLITVHIAVSLSQGNSDWTWWVLYVGDVYCWFYFKNAGDDDRWKRRRARLAQKVAEVGGRLEVVPASDGAP